MGQWSFGHSLLLLALNIMRKKCVVCLGIIYRKGEGILGRLSKNQTFRRPEDVTCSRKCAKYYKRIFDYIGMTMSNRLKRKYQKKYKK